MNNNCGYLTFTKRGGVQAISQLLQNWSKWNILYFLSLLLSYITEKISSKSVQQFLRDATTNGQINRQIKIPKISFFDSVVYELFLGDCFIYCFLFHIQTQPFYYFMVYTAHTSRHRFHIRQKYNCYIFSFNVGTTFLFNIHISKLFLRYLEAMTWFKRKLQIRPFDLTRRRTTHALYSCISMIPYLILIKKTQCSIYLDLK